MAKQAWFTPFGGPGQSGVGLMAVIFSAATIAALVVASTLYTQNRVKERALRNATDGRNFAYKMLKASASSPDTLFVSALAAPAANKELRRCVWPGNGICTATTPAAALPITLSVPFSKTHKSIQMTGLSATDKKAYFSNRGLHAADCTPGATCPFWGRSWFWAQCANNAPSCETALKIYVRTQVAMIPGASLADNVRLSEYPSNKRIAADPMYESVAVTTQDIRNEALMQCPEGAFMVGVQADGMINCRCDQGYRENGKDPATGWPNCLPIQTCDVMKNEVLAVDPVTGDPKCVKLPASDYDCKSFDTPSNGQVSCDKGWRMQQAGTSNDCLIENIDGVGEVVTCGEMKITCCKKK